MTTLGRYTQRQAIRPTRAPAQRKWDMVRGKVLSSTVPTAVFRGDEILEVSVVDASRADASSILLGRQRIPLAYGQQFPIRFQFLYDKSRANDNHGSRTMQARITRRNGQLLFVNDTHIPWTSNVKIDVIKV